MDNLLKEKLGSRAQRGSKPRCHRITQGANEEVAKRLTSLISPWGEVSENDNWMPKGFMNLSEAQLDKSSLINDLDIKDKLKHWWLSVSHARASTPNLDIASTCKIGGQQGLLLVEAKAHKAELVNEGKGKDLFKSASENSIQNHKRIEMSILEASNALSRATNLTWNISARSHYQMANRFTWAWKLAHLGFPVILVYLGFLNATDMNSGGKDRPENLLPTHKVWEDLVIEHSKDLFPSRVWDSCWKVDGQSFVPLIRSVSIPYDQEISQFDVFGRQ
jgi:hypothetical protein